MRQPCQAEELRTLPLFESLTEPQLEWLCAAGHVTIRQAGPLCVETLQATHFYVLIEGEAVTSKRSGGVEVDIARTSRRGVFYGVWSADPRDGEYRYDSSVRLTATSRLFAIRTEDFVRFLRTHLPMALDLREGHLVDERRQRQSLQHREMLLALGALTAGLTDQLHSSSAALDRAITDLRIGVGEMRRDLVRHLDVHDGGVQPTGRGFTAESLRVLFSLEDEVAEQAAKYAQQLRPVAGAPYVAPLTPAELRDRGLRISRWLHDCDIGDGTADVTTFVGGGVDVDVLERVAALVDEVGTTHALPTVVSRLRQTIDTELRMGEIVDACERIAALLTGVEQYSQMDRGVYQSVDIHDLLRSTGVMFGDRIAMPGKGKPVTLVKDLDHSLPEILCYPGDLNQVWTGIFDNALQAMDGLGTLTIRTRREGDAMVRVEICDDGPGIPTDVIDRVFTPFFTTKPKGTAAGLGLDLARRIVVDKHQGTISVQSEPGDTRFIVCLPLRAPAPTMRGLEDG